jgi:beta-glucanase (GH16 family)
MKSLILALLLFFAGCGSESSETENSDLYILALNDDFEYFDASIWQKASWINGAPFYNAWCPEQIDFNNSLVTLTLMQKDCQGLTHASGEYRTFDTFKYGRYSVRFQASDINGTISSFFTYTGPSQGSEWDEIDIEILGKDPTKIQLNYWRNGNEHPVLRDLGFDASEGMHEYSFVWHQEYIKWYVDGVEIYSVYENHKADNDSLPINAGKIIINLWAATGIESWSGSYEDNTTAHTSYDFVKYEAFR